jgi:hypothetical protein
MRRASLVLCTLLAVACEKKETPKPETPKAETPKPQPAIEPLPAASAEPIEAPEVTVRAEGSTVHIVWSTPPGTGVNEDAPFRVRWSRSEGLDAPPEMKEKGAKVKDGFDVPVKPFAGAPRANLGGTIDLVVCDTATHAVCVPVKRTLDLGFIVTKDAPKDTKLVVKLPEAKGAR